MSTTPTPTLAPREQRVIEALRGFSQGRRRFAVSIAEIAKVVGLSCGETSRAVTKLWLQQRIRVQQAPSAREPSVVELLDDEPELPPESGADPPDAPTSEQQTESAPRPHPPAPEPTSEAPPAPSPEGEPVEPKEGGRGEVETNDSTDVRTNETMFEKYQINDSERNDPTRAREEKISPIANTVGDTANEQNPHLALARECAGRLGDTANLTAYLVLASRYPEHRLRQTLEVVLAVPDDHIRRSRGALFTHLMKQGL